MKNTNILLLGALSLALNLSVQAEGKWITLFDGKKVTGLRGYGQKEFPGSGWRVGDGTLKTIPRNKGGKPRDLATDISFTDFEFECEWKVAPGGNSGIMYRVSETDGPTYFTGPEMQVLDNAVAGGDLLHAAGSDYALHAPAEDNSRPVGEWNEVRMLVDGAHVEYWMNGVQQCSYELWSEDWNARVAASKFKQWPGFGMNKRGHIALQDHGNPVWYRNIVIRTGDLGYESR